MPALRALSNSSEKKRVMKLVCFLVALLMVSVYAAANVFSLPVFTREFCAKLMEELEHFEKTDLPKGRPNTMNKGGVSFNLIWEGPFCHAMLE